MGLGQQRRFPSFTTHDYSWGKEGKGQRVEREKEAGREEKERRKEGRGERGERERREVRVVVQPRIGKP